MLNIARTAKKMAIIAKNVRALKIKITAGKTGLTKTGITKIDGNPRNTISPDITPAITKPARTKATEDKTTGDKPARDYKINQISRKSTSNSGLDTVHLVIKQEKYVKIPIFFNTGSVISLIKLRNLKDNANY